MSPIETVTSRLQTRVTGRGTYLARCPAHADSSPSLSVTETSDGRVLLYCHAGCSTKQVLTTIGLGMSDLFPKERRRSGRARVSISAREAISVIHDEASVFAVIAHDLLVGRDVPKESLELAIQAAAKIAQVKHEVELG